MLCNVDGSAHELTIHIICSCCTVYALTFTVHAFSGFLRFIFAVVGS